MKTEAPVSPQDDVEPAGNPPHGSSFDPILTLASVLDATPGSHAVLLGAGISVSAGVPSAWGVQQELIRRLARAEKKAEAEIGDPHAWYRSRFGAEATYESLLGDLGQTPHERQAILREFFEPEAYHADVEAPEPSRAHQALARLATSGSVRLFLTLNFDHLMEKALREAGIEPTVVRSVDDLRGLAPLHTLRAVVVHLHGDYLTPTAMRNTTTELADYESELQTFLGRVLSEHALLAVGWSAEYDPALRAVVDANLLQRYASYWITRGDLQPKASDLANRHRIVHVRGDADSEVGRLADAVASIAEREARHPLSVAESVGAAKRELAGRRVAVGTHDRLRSELTRLRDHPDFSRPLHELEQEPYPQIVARLTEATMVPASLVAAAAYWGDESTDRWWFDDLRRFSANIRGSGLTRLLALPRLCGTLLFEAALVSSVAAGRYELTRNLLRASADRDSERQQTLSERLLAAGGFASRDTPSADVLGELRPIFVEHLALGGRAYEEAWELADVLALVEDVVRYPSFPDRMSEFLSRQALEPAADGRDVESRQALASIADLVNAIGVHVRCGRHVADRQVAPAVERLLSDVRREGRDHPLVVAGFGGGEARTLAVALAAISFQVGRIGQSRAYQAVFSTPGHGGVIPDYIWIDAGEVPTF